MYLDKIKEILAVLKITNYEVFGGIKNKDLIFEELEKKLETFPAYVNIVIREQIMTPIWRERYEGEDLTDKIMKIDQQRKLAHDRAIAAVEGLNVWCSKLSIEPFAKIDTSDRYAVAAFIGKFVTELYDTGIGKSIDDIVIQKAQSREEFDVKVPFAKAIEGDER